MPWIIAKLVFGGRWLRAFLKDAAKWVLRHPWQTLAIVAILAAVHFWNADRASTERADNLALQLDTQRHAYAEAQRQAAILARAAREAQERRYKETADEADKQADGLRADLRDAGARYAAANGLRSRACPAGGAPGGTLAAAEGDSAESSNGPGADAVVLSRDDFDILNENTARLIAVREWALGL